MVPAHALETAAAPADGAAEGEVKVAAGVGVQVEAKGMEPVGEVPVIVEVFIEVGLAILVEVMVAGDLVIGHGVDDIIDDLEPERLVLAGGKAFPCDLVQVIVNALDDPDVPVPGADGGACAVGKEIKAAEAHA